jgi:hypothetical protein
VKGFRNLTLQCRHEVNANSEIYANDENGILNAYD